METIEEVNEFIGKVIKEYNKVVKYTLKYDIPLDGLMKEIVFSNVDVFENVKPNLIIAGVFQVWLMANQVKDISVLDKAFKDLRVLSKKQEIIDLTIKMIPHLNAFDDDDDEFFDDMDEAFEDIYEQFDLLTQNSKFPHPIDMPKKNVMRQINKLQQTLTYDESLLDDVVDLCFLMHEQQFPFLKMFIYDLLHVCPFAYTAMSFLLNDFNHNDRKDLIESMISAFEIVNEDLLKETYDDFYKTGDFKEYILAIDSLAFLEKHDGNFNKAYDLYSKGLLYDNIDYLDMAESILLPTLMLGNQEEFMNKLIALNDDSIYKAYLNLYTMLVIKEPCDQEFVIANKLSDKIMTMICEDKDLYDKMTPKEKRFIEDFYQIFKEYKKPIHKLKEIYFDSI